MKRTVSQDRAAGKALLVTNKGAVNDLLCVYT